MKFPLEVLPKWCYIPLAHPHRQTKSMSLSLVTHCLFTFHFNERYSTECKWISGSKTTLHKQHYWKAGAKCAPREPFENVFPASGKRISILCARIIDTTERLRLYTPKLCSTVAFRFGDVKAFPVPVEEVKQLHNFVPLRCLRDVFFIPDTDR